MKKHSSLDKAAAQSARQAHSQNTLLQRDLRALRDSMEGLHSSIHGASIKTPHSKTKKTTSNPFSFLSNLTSGYASLTQSAGSNLAQLLLGQRIR